MALQFSDLTAWIAVGDRAVDVYCIEKPQPNLVTCWIASEAGKRFSVNWRNATREFPLQGTVTIDGLECDSHIILDALSFPNRRNSVGISYARTSGYTQSDFAFPGIQVTDDVIYPHIISQNHPPGLITLEIWKLEVTSVVSLPSFNIPSQCQTLHGRSQKTGMHHFQHGEECYSSAPIVDMVAGHRIGDSPYVTFTFKYCPIETLMTNKIVPRPRELKIILDPATEIRQLEERLSTLRAKKGSSKARGSNPYHTAGSNQGVKGSRKTKARFN